MRDFVQNISSNAKINNSSFLVIPQNGLELLIENKSGVETPITKYIAAIDGVGCEDLFYGFENDNSPTSPSERDYMISLLDVAKLNNLTILVTDYCWTPSYVDDSYTQNANQQYISFAANHRELDTIPPYPPAPYNSNLNNISSLTDAQNFLYLINPSSFANKTIYLQTLQSTAYDILIIDLFYDSQALTPTEIQSLKIKATGGTRLVIAYMSIGEAENYRYYWQPEWSINPPPWIVEENPNWPGNYKVRYWDPNWQRIIYGTSDSYLQKILDAGFDGVYLDIIDAFEYFENVPL